MVTVCSFTRQTNKQKQIHATTPTGAAAHSEAVGARRALVAASANHVGFAATLPAHLAALSAEGTLGVALTR